jgi:predicted MFS family arabinose efflux permease
MVGREDLINAVALNSLLFNVARMTGPAAAALLLPVVGAGPCFMANGLSYVAVLWALSKMDVAGVPRPPGRKLRPRSLRDVTAAFVGGFSFVSKQPGLTALLVAAGMVSLCGWPFLALLPALAANPLGAGERGYSLMLSGMGAGALLAALAAATYGSPQRRRIFLGAGVAVLTVGLVALSVAKALPVAVAGSALGGFGLILFLVTGQSTLQLSAGDSNRGQVMAIWVMVQSGGMPLGNLVTGLTADRWGVPLVLLVQALICGTAAMALVASSGLRRHGPKRGRDA